MFDGNRAFSPTLCRFLRRHNITKRQQNLMTSHAPTTPPEMNDFILPQSQSSSIAKATAVQTKAPSSKFRRVIFICPAPFLVI
jgi:hypothetical protein